MDRRRPKSASATGGSRTNINSWNPIQKEDAVLHGGKLNRIEWPVYNEETEESKNRKQREIAWKSVEKIHDFMEQKNQKIVDSALHKTKEVAHALTSTSTRHLKKIKATGITSLESDDLYADVDLSIDDPSFCTHFLQAVRHENASAEVLFSTTLKPTMNFGEIIGKTPRSSINGTTTALTSPLRPMYIVSKALGNESTQEDDDILQEEHRNESREQKQKARPLSASVIPSKKSDLSSSSMSTKAHVDTTENIASSSVVRPWSARISPSKKRDILSQHVETKWAEMMYRSPSFKQQNLKKLEQETYDLLEKVFLPPTAATSPRTSRSSSPRRMKGNDTNENLFDEVACGTAVHLARQKQRKQIAHETSTRIQIEKASQTIYRFLCLRFLIRKRNRMLKSIETQVTEQTSSESPEFDEDKGREGLCISEVTEANVPAIPSLKTKILQASKPCFTIETKRKGRKDPDIFAVDNLLNQAATTTRVSPTEIRRALKKQAAAAVKAELMEKQKQRKKKKKSTKKTSELKPGEERWDADNSMQPPKLDAYLDRSIDPLSHQVVDHKLVKKQWSANALDLMDMFMNQLDGQDKEKSENKVRTPSASLLKPTQSSINSVYVLPYVPPSPKAVSIRPTSASPRKEKKTPTAPTLPLEEPYEFTSEAKELIVHPHEPSIESNIHREQEDRGAKLNHQEKPTQEPPNINIIPSESMPRQIPADNTQPVDKNQMTLPENKRDVPDGTEIVSRPQPSAFKTQDNEEMAVTIDSVIAKVHDEDTKESESSVTVSTGDKDIPAPLMETTVDSANGMDTNQAALSEDSDDDELQIQVPYTSSNVELSLLEEVEQILASAEVQPKSKEFEKQMSIDAIEVLSMSNNMEITASILDAYAEILSAPDPTLSSRDSSVSGSARGLDIEKLQESPRYADASKDIDDEMKDLEEYEDDYEFEEEDGLLKLSSTTNLPLQNASLDANDTVLNAPAKDMGDIIPVSTPQESGTKFSIIASEEDASIKSSFITNNDFYDAFDDTSLDVRDLSTTDVTCQAMVNTAITSVKPDTKPLPFELSESATEILTTPSAVESGCETPSLCVETHEEKLRITSDGKDTDEIGPKSDTTPSSSRSMNKHFGDEVLSISAEKFNGEDDLTSGNGTINPVEHEVLPSGSQLDEDMQSISEKKDPVDDQEAKKRDQRNHKELFIIPALQLHKLPVPTTPLNIKILDTVHPDSDEEYEDESSSDNPIVFTIGPEVEVQATRNSVAEYIVQTVAPIELKQPGIETVRRGRAAIRIQRQFRVFISRRLLEDNLKFFLRQNKRKVRKQAKDEAKQTHQVCTETKEESMIDVKDHLDIPVADEKIAAFSMDSKSEEKDEIESKNLSPRLSSSAMDISVNVAQIETFSPVFSVADERHIPSSSPNSILNMSERSISSPQAANSIGSLGDDDDYSFESSADFSKQTPEIKEVSLIPVVASATPRLSELDDLANLDVDEVDDLVSELNSKSSGEHFPLDQPVFTSTTPSPPHGGVESWQRNLDGATNKSFYYNPSTGISQWYAPQEVNSQMIQSSSNIDTNWEYIKANSTLLETMGNWSKYMDSISQTFYYNSHTNEYVTIEPQEYTDQKSKLLESNERKSWSLRRSNSIRSQTLGEWQVFIDQETKIPFYYNTLTGESAWEKPSSFEQRNTIVGRDRENWDLRRKQSIKAHTYGEWQEFIDQQTNLPFYYNTRTGENSWEKPVHFVQSSASMNASYSQQQYQQVQEANTSISSSKSKWVMYIDPSTSLPYYMNMETQETSWEKPIGFHNTSATTAGAATLPPSHQQGHSNDDDDDDDDDDDEYAISIDSQIELDI